LLNQASTLKQEADTPASCKHSATAQEENTEKSATKGDDDSTAIGSTIKLTIPGSTLPWNFSFLQLFKPTFYNIFKQVVGPGVLQTLCINKYTF